MGRGEVDHDELIDAGTPVDEVDAHDLHRQTVLADQPLGDHLGLGSPPAVSVISLQVGIRRQARADG